MVMRKQFHFTAHAHPHLAHKRHVNKHHLCFISIQLRALSRLNSLLLFPAMMMTAQHSTTAELPHVIVVISIAVSYTSHHQDSLQRRWIGNKWMWHEIGNRNSLYSSLLHCDFHEGWGVAVDNGAEWALWEFTKREQMQNCGKSRGALKNIFQWLYIQFSKRLISSIDNTSSNDVELKGGEWNFFIFYISPAQSLACKSRSLVCAYANHSKTHRGAEEHSAYCGWNEKFFNSHTKHICDALLLLLINFIPEKSILWFI